jgi:hypothetical protein
MSREYLPCANGMSTFLVAYCSQPVKALKLSITKKGIILAFLTQMWILSQGDQVEVFKPVTLHK